MQQLHTVVGALLRDLAQARLTSDLYSREISLLYEKDSLLRLFPVPRTEIQEVEINLKFAISKVEIDKERNERKQALISQIWEKSSANLITVLFDSLLRLALARKIREWEDLVTELKTNFRKKLETLVLNFFESNTASLIIFRVEKDQTKLNLNKQKASDGISKIFEDKIFLLESVQEIDKQYQILKNVRMEVSTSIKKLLEMTNDEIERIDATEEFKVVVDVTSGKLLELPESAISTIKLTTQIRNYVWTEVDKVDDQVVRKLIPE